MHDVCRSDCSCNTAVVVVVAVQCRTVSTVRYISKDSGAQHLDKPLQSSVLQFPRCLSHACRGTRRDFGHGCHCCTSSEGMSHPCRLLFPKVSVKTDVLKTKSLAARLRSQAARCTYVARANKWRRAAGDIALGAGRASLGRRAVCSVLGYRSPLLLPNPVLGSATP
jgi:hypothetical protein